MTDKRLQLLNNFGMKGLNDVYKIYNKRKIFLSNIWITIASRE